MKIKQINLFLVVVFIGASCTPNNISQTALPISTAFATNPQNSTKITPTPTLLQPIATYTFVPTFTPSSPNISLEPYELRDWSAENADLLIAQISSNLHAQKNNPYYQSTYGFAYYMEQFDYLVFAEKEALFRFPNALQATRWKWDLCYNLAVSYQLSSTEAPELACYEKLIEEGLNSGEVNISEISSWFYYHEPRFSFEITSIGKFKNYSNIYILTLENNTIFLTYEKNGVFNIHGLMSSMFYFRESDIKFQVLDLTGDNFPEIVINFNRSNCCGSYSSHYVYEFSFGTPQQLLFENLKGFSSSVSSPSYSTITNLNTDSEAMGFLFIGHYEKGDPLFHSCNLMQYEKYYWNNTHFEIVDKWLSIDSPDQYDDIEFCEFVTETVKDRGELNVAVETIGDRQIDNADITKEELLYRLGEYHARINNNEKAKEYFTKLISMEENSSAFQHIWIENAQLFLDGYKNNDSYYKTCSSISDCDMRDALQGIIDRTQPELFSIIVETLNSQDISIKESGYIDFDNDGNYEQWIVVRHPNRKENEVWVLVETSDKVWGLFITSIGTSNPVFTTFIGSNKIEISESHEKSLFSLEKLNLKNQPYILFDNTDLFFSDKGNYQPYNLIQASLINNKNKLMSGDDPARIKTLLTKIEKSQTYECTEVTFCADLYYLIGLTNELLGDNNSAIEAYLKVWEMYPDSLYTFMARSKLELAK